MRRSRLLLISLILITLSLLLAIPIVHGAQNLTCDSIAEMAGFYMNGGATWDALSDGDICIVFKAGSDREFIFYIFDVDSGQTEDGDMYVTPDYTSSGRSYTGTGRWVKMSLSINALSAESIQDDLISKADFADEDWGDMSVSSNTVTLDNDVVGTAEMANGDYGDFSFTDGSASLDADVVAPAEMANADHGDFTYLNGVATLDNNVVDSAEIVTNAVGADEIDANATIFIEGLGINTDDNRSHLDVNGEIRADEILFESRESQALITFIFDDGFETDYTIMKVVFDDQNEVACSAVVSNWVGNANRLTSAQLTEMENDGWEILGHTKTHADLTSLTEAQIRTELSASKAALESLGYTIKNLVYPSHYSNYTVRRLTREYYRSARGQHTGINSLILNTFNLNSLQIDNHLNLSTYQTYVDTAESENKWMIFYMHQTDANDATTVSSLIDYIQGKSISIVTVDQALDSIGNMVDVSEFTAIGEKGLKGKIIEVIGDEGNDAELYLDADDGDDNPDTWILKSEVSNNEFSITNHITKYFSISKDGLVKIKRSTDNTIQMLGSDAGNGSTLYIRRNRAANDTNQPLVNIIQDATTDDQLAVRIQGDSSSANTLEVYSGANIGLVQDENSNVGIGTVSPGGQLDIAPGTIGGLFFDAAEATVNMSDTNTVTCQVNVPSGSKLLGCQLRVDSALAGGDTWDAAYSGGSTQSIATNQAVAKNTKANKFYDENAASANISSEVDVNITKNGGGHFTAQGTIRAIVYYQGLTTMGDAS